MANHNKSRHILGEDPIEKKERSAPGSTGIDQVGKDVMKGLWEQLLKGSTESVKEQVFGGKNKSGELKAGQEVVLKQAQKREQRQEDMSLKLEQHREYFRKIERREISADKTHEQVEIEQDIERLRIEIKKLIKASKELQVQFKEVAKDEVIISPGKYHLTFFDWVFTVVRNARIRIEEGTNWLSAFSSKKKHKQYWNMFKKHGTTFGLSNERVVSTQTG